MGSYPAQTGKERRFICGSGSARLLLTAWRCGSARRRTLPTHRLAAGSKPLRCLTVAARLSLRLSMYYKRRGAFRQRTTTAQGRRGPLPSGRRGGLPALRGTGAAPLQAAVQTAPIRGPPARPYCVSIHWCTTCRSDAGHQERKAEKPAPPPPSKTSPQPARRPGASVAQHLRPPARSHPAGKAQPASRSPYNSHPSPSANWRGLPYKIHAADSCAWPKPQNLPLPRQLCCQPPPGQAHAASRR